MTRQRTLISTIMFFTLTLCVGLGHAQQAPDGNAHPETQQVTRTADQIVNPFGDPVITAFTTEQKSAFADALDLSPLEKTPVFHNGRVKIISTLADETISALTGKGKHFDLIVEENPDGSTKSVQKIKYDPMFTLFDMVLDPMYYLDRPLLGINYLPLRRAILDAYEQDPENAGRSFNYEGWLKTGMVSPRMASRYATPAFNKYSDSEPFRNAVGKLDRSMGLFRNSIGNFEVVAPESEDQLWKHLGSLPDGSPARDAALAFGNAWRAGDAAGVNAAAQQLADALAQINPQTQQAASPGLESIYNKAHAFEWGLWLYLFSLVALILAFGTGRKTLATIGVVLLFLALGFHGFGFTLRSLIAERFAIQNQFESMTGISFFAAIVGTGLMLWKKQWLFGAAAAGTGFLILITATTTGIPGEHIEREAAILNTSVLLKYHVTTVLTSYGLITLGFIVSLFYLGTYYSAKFFRAQPATEGAPALASGALGNLDDSGKPAGLQRTLKDLDTATMTVLQLAFWTLGVGILLGAWWADHSWGRWWAFDPKETWALVTWIVYLIVIHVRMTGLKNRGLTTAWLSVSGFIVMLWTYFGVNLLLPGLHAYA
ncbi:MAG: cytochrome c biogenesis protein CcsA [Phycisphaerales bacterium]|nr:cytochrome c biogenesis protein CcsA [Phycisphaerales bacterium]